ncbi:MAG: rhomboid family intramembrane serine protease, partial [Planctomycetales bacterium]|nr:rhomboid family intramembrane serine protease [Planctomycetales bacterium]
MIFPYNTDAPIYHYPIATISLIVTNALLFLIVPARFLQVPLPEELLLEGETNPTFTMLLEYGNGLHPLQWLASPFMHADILHLASNMLVLWSFGLVVEGKVGSVVFVALYMLIAVGQSALEQAMMLFASGGASLGASAAIFGILGIAVVWAPSNNFDVVWFLGFRGGSFEMPILLYGFLSLVLEVFTLVHSNFSVSGSLLHLMGLGFGLGLGFLWLRRDWVDCEGWDLITVLRGREGQTHHEQQAALDAEANELLRSTRKNLATSSRQEPSKDAGPTRSKGKKERKRGGRSDSMPKTTAQPSAQSQTSEQAVAELVATGNLAVALKLIAKLRQD